MSPTITGPNVNAEADLIPTTTKRASIIPCPEVTLVDAKYKFIRKTSFVFLPTVVYELTHSVLK
jgi:hypothetical protein